MMSAWLAYDRGIKTKRQVMEEIPFLVDPLKEEIRMQDETLRYKENLAGALGDAIRLLENAVYPTVAASFVTTATLTTSYTPALDTQVRNRIQTLVRDRDRLRVDVERELREREWKEKQRLEHEAARDLTRAISPNDIYSMTSIGFFEKVREVVQKNPEAFK